MNTWSAITGQHWHVIVVGGGVTGAGILRDLAMRGIKTLLVEQGDLAHGSSSRFHGLLHSGARYVVSDPVSAKECLAENTLLRVIAPDALEHTEGLFVRTREDDPAFEPVWLAACESMGISAEPIPVNTVCALEPLLSRDIVSAYRVPDAAVDGFRLTWQNVHAAARYQGVARTYTRLMKIFSQNGRVTGVQVRDERTGDLAQLACDMLINAAGSWAGRVAALADINVPLRPDRGTLLAFNHRVTSRVINRLHMPGDGDILVPHGSISILGTTSRATNRPDDTTPTASEVLELLNIGRVLFPSIDTLRLLRAFAGTRPLYTPDGVVGRDASRNFVVLDHADNGLDGFLTICGGKLTTYRLMAERLCDRVAAQLGVTHPCRTATEQLMPEVPNALRVRAAKHFPMQGLDLAIARLGNSLEDTVMRMEAAPWKNALVCECELITVAEAESIAAETSTHTLNDVRRRTRLGMGTCQGTFCGSRAVGAMLDADLIKEGSAAALLAGFQQERWQGLRPVLWGTEVREALLARGIYAATLNIDASPEIIPEAAPEPTATSHVTLNTPDNTTYTVRPVASRASSEYPKITPSASTTPLDCVVVGAGLSGIMAALFAAQRGKRVRLISQGVGALAIGGGTIDMLGFLPTRHEHDTATGACSSHKPYGPHSVDHPLSEATWAALTACAPQHPYVRVGRATALAALHAFCDLCFDAGYPMNADLPVQSTAGNADALGNKYTLAQGRNTRLITGLGTTKPSLLVPPTMTMRGIDSAPALHLVTVEGLKDHSPRLIMQGLFYEPRFHRMPLIPVTLKNPFTDKKWRGRDLSSLDLARYLDTEEGQTWFIEALQRTITPQHGVAHALVPPLLGTRPDSRVMNAVFNATGVHMHEALAMPPAITGLRLRSLLMRLLNAHGVDVLEHATVVGSHVVNGRCVSLTTSPAPQHVSQHPQGKRGVTHAQERTHEATSVILATGGLLHGGLQASPTRVCEPIFNLTLSASPTDNDWSRATLYGTPSHGFTTLGVPVDKHLRPCATQHTNTTDDVTTQDAEHCDDAEPLLTNVHIVGSTLGLCDHAYEKSGNGLAIVSAYAAAQALA